MIPAHNGIKATSLHGVAWKKSTFSNPSGNCVELAKLPNGKIAVRNSRHPSGPALVYERGEIDAFLRAAKAGEFDSVIA
jgi:Domain of unknown function (DUF397)